MSSDEIDGHGSAYYPSECVCGTTMPDPNDEEKLEAFEPGCRHCDRWKTARLLDNLVE